MFGRGSDDPALFLIGDPKQAIYGFRGGDVHTYLEAGTHAQAAPPLSRNFRSRPAVLRAITALYGNARAMFDAGNADASPFIDTRIEFRHVEAGGQRGDGDFVRDGEPARALTVWRAPGAPLDDKGKRKPWRAGEARALATNACVAAIHAVLSDARAGKARIDGVPVQPGDIAVLVRSHFEATMVQQALALAGIAAVAAGKQSLFATIEARELHALLLAVLHSGDDGRLRAALSTVLVGVDALGIDHLESDADAHRDWQQRAMGWRERLQRGGPLALVGDLCAANAERLLGLLDGERRMSNLPATGRVAAGSTGQRTRPARAGGLAGPAHRQRRCQRRNPVAARGIRRAPRAHRDPAQEQGPGISAGVPALRRHRSPGQGAEPLLRGA